MQDEVKVTQWRKKPVVIAAVQINTQQDAEKCPGICTGGLSCKSKGAPDGAWPHIHTLEGDHTWTPGDWCITGVKGERYFCKPDIFEQTYEPVTDQAERETLARMGWRDIESAPKDGTWFTAYWPVQTFEDRVQTTRWLHDDYRFVDASDFMDDLQPIAWMPLPPAPEAGQ